MLDFPKWKIWAVTLPILIGKVTKVLDSEVEVELGTNMRVMVVKSTLTQVGTPAAAKPAND